MSFKLLLQDAAQAAGMSEEKARSVVQAVVGAITVRLQDGERIEVPGLGVFGVRERKERLGRNPQTGEAVTIPAGTRAKFSPAAALRRALNGPK